MIPRVINPSTGQQYLFDGRQYRTAEDELTGLPTQKFLTTNGLGTGTINHAVDYSGAVTDIYFQAVYRYLMNTLFISVSDNASFNQTDFGGIANGITNGVTVHGFLYGVERALLSGFAVKKNYEWLALTPGVTLTSFAGTAQTMEIDINLTNEYGTPFILNPGDRIIVRLHDNFSSLVALYAGIRGKEFIV